MVLLDRGKFIVSGTPDEMRDSTDPLVRQFVHGLTKGPLTDRRPASLIVPSALAGALLVLVADVVCRILPLVTELRLGIALSLIGAPFFLHLLLRMRRGLA